jgi:Xaa-Pro aminopeptidase
MERDAGLSANKKAYERRISGMRKQMEASGLDLVVVYSNGEYSFVDMDPFYYLSNFKPIGRHSLFFLPTDEDPALLISPSWDFQRAKALSWIGDVTATNDFGKAVEGLILKKDWKRKNVGFIGMRRLNTDTGRIIASQFEVPLQAADHLMTRVTVFRDELEIGLARKAAEIAEEGYQHLLRTAKLGMTEYELAAEVYCFIKGLGADDNFQLISASQHNLAVNAPSDRRLDTGDVILAEISPSYKGQFIQICRTSIVGSPTRMQSDKYQILIDSLQCAMRAGIPGTKVQEVTKRMNDSISEAGYGKYCYPPYMRVRGHGFGLGSTQPGQLTMDNETMLEEGMMFIVHPNQYIPETGYLLCGETVIVTKAGLEPLTRWPCVLDSIPV